MAQHLATSTDARDGPMQSKEFIRRILDGDYYALDLLYRIISELFKIIAFRYSAANDADDLTNITFLGVVKGLRRKGLVPPERLLDYIGRVAQRRLAAHIQEIERRSCQVPPHEGIRDSRTDLETALIEDEQKRIMKEQLQVMPAREREVLVRFYCQEQPKERIEAELGLTETQFRLIKSRAKALLAQRVRNRLSRHQSIKKAPRTTLPSTAFLRP